MKFSSKFFEMQVKASLSAFILMGAVCHLDAMDLEETHSQSSLSTPGKKVPKSKIRLSTDSNSSLSPTSPHIIIGVRGAAKRSGNASTFTNPKLLSGKTNTSSNPISVDELLQANSSRPLGGNHLSAISARSSMSGSRGSNVLSSGRKQIAGLGSNVLKGGRGNARNPIGNKGNVIGSAVYQQPETATLMLQTQQENVVLPGSRPSTPVQRQQQENTMLPAAPLTPEVVLGDVYGNDVTKNLSPGYVGPVLNPSLQITDADEEIHSPSLLRENSLETALSVVDESAVTLRGQRLDFESALACMQDEGQIALSIGSCFSEEADSCLTEDMDTTEADQNLRYLIFSRDYENCNQEDKKAYLEWLPSQPGFEGVTKDNVLNFLHTKVMDSAPKLHAFFKKSMKANKKLKKVGKKYLESGQQLAKDAAGMVERSNDMRSANSVLWKTLTDLVCREDILQFVGDGQSDVARINANSMNPSNLVKVVEVLMNQFIKSSQMNLNLTQTHLNLTQMNISLESRSIKAQAANEKQTDIIGTLTTSNADLLKTNNAAMTENTRLRQLVLALQNEKESLTVENRLLRQQRKSFLESKSEFTQLLKTEMDALAELHRGGNTLLEQSIQQNIVLKILKDANAMLSYWSCPEESFLANQLEFSQMLKNAQIELNSLRGTDS